MDPHAPLQVRVLMRIYAFCLNHVLLMFLWRLGTFDAEFTMISNTQFAPTGSELFRLVRPSTTNQGREVTICDNIAYKNGSHFILVMCPSDVDMYDYMNLVQKELDQKCIYTKCVCQRS